MVNVKVTNFQIPLSPVDVKSYQKLPHSQGITQTFCDNFDFKDQSQGD